MFVLSILT